MRNDPRHQSGLSTPFLTGWFYPVPQVCYKPFGHEISWEGVRTLNDITPGLSSPLIDAFEHQDEFFASAFDVLQSGVAQHAFPAASAAITDRGKLVALKALGHFTYDRIPSAEVVPSTLFDLASLTKVVATTPMAMLLYERGLLDLDAPVSAIVPEFISDAGKDPRRREVTLRMLLAHSSGLPAYEKLFLKARTRDELLRAAFSMPLSADPGSRAEYSDIGFFILGVALERLGDESLDRFCQREIFAPLAMPSTAFNPPESIRSRIPPTQDDRSFRNRIIQGEVQDENASVLGGVEHGQGVDEGAQVHQLLLQEEQVGDGHGLEQLVAVHDHVGAERRSSTCARRTVFRWS